MKLIQPTWETTDELEEYPPSHQEEQPTQPIQTNNPPTQTPNPTRLQVKPTWDAQTLAYKYARNPTRARANPNPDITTQVGRDKYDYTSFYMSTTSQRVRQVPRLQLL